MLERLDRSTRYSSKLTSFVGFHSWVERFSELSDHRLTKRGSTLLALIYTFDASCEE